MRNDELRPGVHWVGAIDWDRRSFDELVPIPAGTTYNCYLVRGREKTALIDTVDPEHTATLLEKLDALGVKTLDYVISNHAEQDHSGAIPAVLARFPEARLVATAKARKMLADLLDVDPARMITAEDGGRLPLGGRTLRFVHFPWVHWPETMLTWLEEDQILFTGDLFGAHLAARPLGGDRDVRLPSELKRYYACIMMPYRKAIARSLPKVRQLPVATVAPSHGPIHASPAAVVEAYRSWVEDAPRSLAVLPYVSMHASTGTLVRGLSSALEARGVEVELCNLADPDLGKLAMASVDAATLVFGSPAVLAGLHPKVASAALFVNALQPKVRWVSLVGSFGWGAKLAEQLSGLVDVGAELIDPVLVRGVARDGDRAALGRLADALAARHATLAAPVAAAANEPQAPAPAEAERIA